jgi:hypothetical protein
MPRSVVERTFPDGLIIPMDQTGAQLCHAVVRSNAHEQVTWVHSYVSEDKQKSYCIYDGPSPEAIRQAARRSHLPVERITEVRVLDPYFYTSSRGFPNLAGKLGSIAGGFVHRTSSPKDRDSADRPDISCFLLWDRPRLDRFVLMTTRGGPMFDFLVDIVGQVIIALVDGATQWRGDHLLAQNIPERATAVRRRIRLRRKRRNMYRREK